MLKYFFKAFCNTFILNQFAELTFGLVLGKINYTKSSECSAVWFSALPWGGRGRQFKSGHSEINSVLASACTPVF